MKNQSIRINQLDQSAMSEIDETSFCTKNIYCEAK